MLCFFSLKLELQEENKFDYEVFCDVDYIASNEGVIYE
jgi:hypothetical protein